MNISKFVLPSAEAQEQTIAQEFSTFVRMFYFMIAGYPGVTENASSLSVSATSPYYDLNNSSDSPCNATVGASNCDAGPVAGMLSLYNQIILGYQDSTWEGVAGVLGTQGYNTCSSIPVTTLDISPLASAMEAGKTLTVVADGGAIQNSANWSRRSRWQL